MRYKVKAQIEIEVEADDEFDIEGALEMEVPTATIVSLTDYEKVPHD